MLQWNARSLYGYDMRHKKAEFYDFLLTFKVLPEVVCIQETWNPQDKKKLRFMGYKEPVSYRRNDQQGGGVATFIREGLDSEEIPYKHKNKHLEVSIVRIFGNNKNVDIINLYTNGKHLISQGDFEHILTLVGKHFIIVGDFNIHDSLWDTEYLGSETAAGKEFNQFVEENDLVILNDGTGTYLSPVSNQLSALDLTLTTRDVSRNCHWYVHQNCLGSDHYPIISKFNYQHKSVLQSQLPRWKLNSANWVLFRKLTSNLQLDYNGKTIEECNELFNSALLDVCSKTIPQTKPMFQGKRRHLPWWNDECTLAVKAKRRAYKLWRRHKTEQLKNEYKKLRSKCKETLEQAQKSKFQELISKLNHKTSSKELWGLISKFNGKPFKPVEVLKSNNTRHQENIDKANALAQHYQKVSSNDLLSPEFRAEKLKRDPDITDTVQASIEGGGGEAYNDLFTFKELTTALNKKKSTAPGADTIHYDMLKYSSDHCKWQLLHLINKSWSEGKLPDQWKLGTIVPLLKPSKPPHDPGSYRPISLTSAVCKVMETMIGTRLTSYVENNHLLAPTQSGFRKNRSTLDQIIRLQTAILKAKMENKKLLCIFLDLEKAFDLMWTNGVLAQLTKFNIKGRLLAWVQDFLKDRKIQVRVGGDISEVKSLDNGSPQGSVLSPILFNILANTQYDVLKDLFAELSQYADDAAAWKSAKSKKRLVQLMQTILDIIYKWAASLGIKISVGKTEVVMYNREKLPDESVPKLKVGDQTLDFKSHGKFLGMTLDSKLTWKKHIDQLIERCKKDLNLMRYLSGTSFGADKVTLIKIYKSLIRSKIDYGCQAYASASQSQLSRLDRIQAAALRIASGAYKSTANIDVQIECCVPPLKLRREELILKYWARSSANGDQLPLNDMYDFSVYDTRRDRAKGKIPFVVQVRDLQSEYQLQDMQVQPPVYADTHALRSINPRETLKPFINKKRDSNKSIEIKTKALIRDNYSSYLQIFTDGSKNESTSEVGCAFAIPEFQLTRKFKLNGQLSIFSAELTAIIEALKWVNTERPDKVVILSDSLSSIRSIRSGNSNSRPDLLIQINQLIDSIIRANIILYMDWCPSHCNVIGNDLADEAAKAGSSYGRALSLRLGKTEAYGIIKKKVKQKWATQWKNHGRGFRWELSSELPVKMVQYSDDRRMDRLYTRLRLGRNGIRFNNQFHNDIDPLCPHCGEIEYTDHYLLFCNFHFIQRQAMFKKITDAFSDIKNITVDTLLNPSPAHAEIIRAAVFDFIKDTDYVKII